MSQDPNLNNASYPLQQITKDQQYPCQQSGEDAQQPGNYDKNLPEKSSDDGQKETLFQPPIFLPHPDFPKGTNSGYTGVPLHDKELGTNEWGIFADLDSKKTRLAFIRKVYLILMLQLLITLGIVALFIFIPSIRDYVKSSNGRWIYWTSLVIFLVLYFVLICSKRAARRFPINMILLGIFTLSMGYMMGTISALYKIESVFIAIGITAFVCLGVTLFTFQTKYDFTRWLGVVIGISWALLGFGIACIFTYSKILYTIYAGLGAVLFSIFLAIDTQLILGGRQLEIDAEDYIFAVLMLYMDIINIFLYILSCFGGGD